MRKNSPKPSHRGKADSKRAAKKFEMATDFGGVSEQRLLSQMSAEKSKAEVLNKLARKYSPTHMRPG